MSRLKYIVGTCAIVSIYCAPVAAVAEDLVFDDTDFTYANPNENVVLRGSIGMMSIVGNEHVYAGTSGVENLSLLVWEGRAPVATIDAKLRFPGDWTLRGRISAATGGDHTMTDYDWLTYAPSYDPNDWDNRSISPNTSLDWYLDADLAVGRDLPINEALTVNVNGGLKYTDVQWTAVGGTYLYSVNAPFDASGTFPDVPGVRYRQQLPEAFLGLDASVADGPWTLEAGGKLGYTFLATATDHHYLRTPPLLFVDHLDYAQVYSVNAKLGYNFSDHMGVFIAGSYEKMMSGHGDTDVYDDSTGALLAHEIGPAGGDLETASISAGLKGNF